MNMIDRFDRKEAELIAKEDPIPKAVNYLLKIGMRVVRDAGRDLLDADMKNYLEPYRSQVVAEKAIEDDRGWKAMEKLFKALAESDSFEDFMRQEAEDRAEDAELRRNSNRYAGVEA